MGNLRETPERKKITEVFRSDRLSFVVSSMCGWRLYMEDAHICEYPFAKRQGMGLFAIFDGHGGKIIIYTGTQCAIFAQRHFSQELQGNANFLSGNYEKALSETFTKMDLLMKTKAGQKQLAAIQQEQYEKDNASKYEGECLAGTTANVILITKDFIYTANAGDSRSVGCIRSSKFFNNKGKSGKNKAKALSYDHKPDNEQEQKRIIKAGGKIEDGRINKNLNLSRALGDFPYKKNQNLSLSEQIISSVPDITKQCRRQFSFIVMGCDGIWERKTNEKMIKWIQKKMDTKGITMRVLAESLLDEELGGNQDSEIGMDNMTTIIISL